MKKNSLRSGVEFLFFKCMKQKHLPTHTDVRKHTHTYTYTYILTYTHTHMHMHAHTHIYTY